MHRTYCDNIIADRESRLKSLDSEWMLDPFVLRKACKLFFFPDSDLFATRINEQLTRFVSWKPDPKVYHTNAFLLFLGLKGFIMPFRLSASLLLGGC